MKITGECFKIIQNVPVKILTAVVYEFSVGDVEDPVVYAAEPLIKWEKSEEGQYIMTNAIEKPQWHQWLDHKSFSTRFSVSAKLKEKDLNYFVLKYL